MKSLREWVEAGTDAPWVRRMLYAGLAVCLMLVAWSEPYSMSCDVLSYLDIADLIRAHQWHWVVNAYWHPAYPALLYLTRTALHATVWNELQAARVLNLLLTVGLFFAVRFVAHSAVQLRDAQGDADAAREPLRMETIEMLAALVTLISVLRGHLIGEVLPDVLLAIAIAVGMGWMMRAAARGRVGASAIGACAAMGASFAVAFWVKSFAWPLFVVALVMLALLMGRRALVSVGTAAVIFAVIAGPYIGALSHEKGRLSTGESGKLVYAWYVDGADRFEQQPHDPARYGLANGSALKHTSTEMLSEPGIYFYPAPHPGTEPEWFDPSYWQDGLKPKFNLMAQIRGIKTSGFVVVQYFALRPVYLLLFGVVMLLGGRWLCADFGWRAMGPVLLLMALQIVMYIIVLVETRYIEVAVMVALVTLLAFVRVPTRGGVQSAVMLVTAVMMGMLLCGAFTDSLIQLKHEDAVEGRWVGAYNASTFNAGRALSAGPGMHAGDTVACLGEHACRDDAYWARLAGVHIRTIVYTHDNPMTVWQKADKDATMRALRATGAKALVSDFGANVEPPAGWRRLGGSELSVLWL